MSAVILSFAHANTAESDCERAERRIRQAISGMPATIVAQAIAYAHRSIRMGLMWPISTDRAIKWARFAIHNPDPSNPTPPRAA